MNHTTTAKVIVSTVVSMLLVISLTACGSPSNNSGGEPAPESSGTPTGPAPSLAQVGQVFISPQLDTVMSPVSGSGGVAVPDYSGGATVSVSKTGQPQQITQNGEMWIPNDDVEFVATEVTVTQLATPFPQAGGSTSMPETTAQFVVDKAPVGEPITLPMAGEAAEWVIATEKSASVTLQVTSGAVVQTINARTGKPIDVKDGTDVESVTLTGEVASAQSFQGTSVGTDSEQVFTGSMSISFPSGTASLSSYVNGAGWAPDGQVWLFVDFTDDLDGTKECSGADFGDGNIDCMMALDDAIDEALFSMGTDTGQVIESFGGSPTGHEPQALYQVPFGSISFALTINASVNMTKQESGGYYSYTYTPGQLDFSHTYTISFQ